MNRPSSRRIVLSIVVALALACALAALAACGQSSKGSGASAGDVRDTATAQLDQIKGVDGEFGTEVAGMMSAELLDSYGIDSAEFLRAYFNGFDYEIGDVKTEGDKATVSVTITCKSASSFKTAFEARMAELAVEHAGEDLDDEAVHTLVGEAAMSALNSADAVKAGPVELTYVQQNGAWASTEDSATALVAAIQAS